uniref:Rab-like protein n=1 Tax=Trepomonas sp. PC1 TaxID=1076344 RepID=A0A146KEB0_9EUKA|eukprot:JAP93781.1 Rab-like protein [Trepomonas sp. PC1]
MNQQKNYDFLVKYTIVGEEKSGKSKFLNRLTENKFENNYDITIGVEFGTITITQRCVKAKLQMCNTAGQECFRSIGRQYYRDAKLVLICVDLSKESEYAIQQIKFWVDEANHHKDEICKLLVIGTKQDIQKCESEVKLACSEMHLQFIPTSAKTNYNIQESAVKSLQIVGIFKFFFKPQTDPIIPDSKTVKFKFCGSGDDTELLKSCFQEYNNQLCFQLGKQKVRFDKGNDIYVFSDEFDRYGASKAKVVICINPVKYVRRTLETDKPTFFVHSTDDLQLVFLRIRSFM